MRKLHRNRAMAAWALLALMSLPVLARDREAFADDVPPPPPEPNPVEVEVPRGGPVWITLSAYSLTSPVIRYRIRRLPKGRLGDPRIVTADTAVVKYQPPAGAGPGEDSFSYQVQSQGGVSAPADVRIKITDKDPVLVAPDEIDFGEVLPGASSRRSMVLQNIGGGLAQGTVRVPDGWTVDGDPDYKLGAGEKQTFTLIFKPGEQRPYTGDVEYTGNPERATDLDGKEVAPVAVATAPVELRQAGALRLGTIGVENHTDATQTLRVTAGPRLETDATLEAPAKGVAEIVVRAKAGDTGEINDHVTVEGEGMKADIPVHAAPVIETAVSAGPSVPAATPHAPVRTPSAAPGSIPASPLAGHAETEAPPEWNLPLLTDSGETEEQIRIDRLEIDETGQHDVQVSCDFRDAGPVRTWLIEAQTVALDTEGKLEAKWVPLANPKLAVQGSRVTALIEHLRPNALYVVRLVGVDELGRMVALSSAGQIWTPRPGGGAAWTWFFLGAATLAALGAWKWKRRPVF